MDNSNSVWRRRAKVVAILDLIFSSIGLLFIIILMVLATQGIGITGNGQLDHDAEAQQKIEKATVIAVWIVAAVTVVVTAIGLWAAVKLLKASEIGREVEEAQRMARTYRTVAIIFLILGALGNFFTAAHLISLIIQFIIRAIFIYVAHKYIGELQGMMETGVPGGNMGKV